MNKYEKTLGKVKTLLLFVVSKNPIDISPLKELVDKATPMKPIIRTFGDGSQTYCSNCDKQLMRLNDRVNDYCPKCGQKQVKDLKGGE